MKIKACGALVTSLRSAPSAGLPRGTLHIFRTAGYRGLIASAGLSEPLQHVRADADIDVLLSGW